MENFEQFAVITFAKGDQYGIAKLNSMLIEGWLVSNYSKYSILLERKYQPVHSFVLVK